MMRGRLYIDGNDAYTEYGMYVVQGGWNELIAYPPLKAVKTNDWQEVDGVEADLSAPVLNTRDIQLKMAVSGYMDGLYDLIALLSDKSYHLFVCASIGRTYRLRLVSMPNLTSAERLGTVTLKLADDFPLYDYNYLPPLSSVVSVGDYLFDGIRFTTYGVRVLQGTQAEVEKTPTVKNNLLRNIPSIAGAMYDDSTVTYKSKDVKIQCLLRAETLTELWRNYDALLYDLIRPEERTLYVEALGQEFQFYYKSCQVSEFYPDGKIWLKFTLTVVFTRDFRIIGDWLLATEDDILVFTEDDQYAIDMREGKPSFPSVRFATNRQTLRLTGRGKVRFNEQ